MYHIPNYVNNFLLWNEINFAFNEKSSWDSKCLYYTQFRNSYKVYKFVLWLFHGFQLTIKLNKLNCISSPLLEYAKLTCLMKDSNMVDSLVLPKIPCMNTTALWDWAITCPSIQVHKIKPQEKVDLLNLCIIKTEST